MEKDSIRQALAWPYAILASAGMIAELTIQPYFHHLEDEQKISVAQSLLLHNFLDYIGDVTNGLAFAPKAYLVVMLLEFAKETIVAEKIKNHLNTLIKAVPYLFFTLMLLLIFDEETEGGLITVGEPFLADIPAGLFGLLAGALCYEQFLMKKQSPSVASPDSD